MILQESARTGIELATSNLKVRSYRVRSKTNDKDYVSIKILGNNITTNLNKFMEKGFVAWLALIDSIYHAFFFLFLN